ncbi:MAG: Hsp33 family molecular chaperone HslO [Desulfobacteraceae bacterium]|jgi:molecular chaperone Hsp33
MKDYLVRIITKNANVRGLACVTSHLVDETCRRNGAHPTACVALGRALTGGALMGALLKTGQRLALRFEGNGPLEKIIVEAESNGMVRGYVKVPHVDLPLKNGKFDVSGALGDSGLLTVVKDLRLREPYTGMVELYTGEIGEDLAFYLTESEQIPSAVGLGVSVDTDGGVSAAGGFIIQSFPPYQKETVDVLIAQIRDMSSITELISEGKTPEQLLDILFSGIPFDILEERPLAFKCSCSRERVEKALIALGREEIEGMISRQRETTVTCEFCRESYQLRREELEKLVVHMLPKSDERGELH